MKWKLLAIVATPLLLAACQQQAQPSNTENPSQGVSKADAPTAPRGDETVILALGDSLFAGYGLEPGQSYPAHLETALNAKGIRARIVNAGVSGDTTAGGLQRIDFVLSSLAQKPSLAIISLGGNDMLRGLSPEETRKNLDAILAKFKAQGIPVLLLGMLAAPNLGADYAGKFNPVYPALAKKYEARLVPFFLQPLMDKPQLVQADHIHPTLAGIDVLVADTVDTVAGALPKGAEPVRR